MIDTTTFLGLVFISYFMSFLVGYIINGIFSLIKFIR